MVPVALLSPYAGKNSPQVAEHIEYANRCVLNCLYAYNEAPFASHLLYTQMLDDDVAEERALGMQAGYEWTKLAVRLVVYTDYGISPGMTETINSSGKPCVMRSIGQNPSGQPQRRK